MLLSCGSSFFLVFQHPLHCVMELFPWNSKHWSYCASGQPLILLYDDHNDTFFYVYACVSELNAAVLDERIVT